jgi:hypothetical protein
MWEEEREEEEKESARRPRREGDATRSVGRVSERAPPPREKGLESMSRAEQIKRRNEQIGKHIAHMQKAPSPNQRRYHVERVQSIVRKTRGPLSKRASQGLASYRALCTEHTQNSLGENLSEAEAAEAISGLPAATKVRAGAPQEDRGEKGGSRDKGQAGEKRAANNQGSVTSHFRCTHRIPQEMERKIGAGLYE